MTMDLTVMTSEEVQAVTEEPFVWHYIILLFVIFLVYMKHSSIVCLQRMRPITVFAWLEVPLVTCPKVLTSTMFSHPSPSRCCGSQHV